MYEIKISTKDIKSKQFQSLPLTYKRTIIFLMITIAIERLENLARNRVKNGRYKAYQVEKTVKLDSGWETHMIIERDSSFFKLLYKKPKVKAGKIERLFSAAKTENEELANKINKYIPTLPEVQNFISLEEINSLPKQIKDILQYPRGVNKKNKKS